MAVSFAFKQMSAKAQVKFALLCLWLKSVIDVFSVNLWF